MPADERKDRPVEGSPEPGLVEEVRLRAGRISGQIEALPRLLERGDGCRAVLQQVAAAEGALGSLRRLVLSDRLAATLHDLEGGSFACGGDERVAEILDLLDQARR